jgi:glutamate 5-kinase
LIEMNFEKANRIVVKLGTTSVISNNKFNSRAIAALAKEVSGFVRKGKQFIIVSSGAIGLGKEKTRLFVNNPAIELQQALAAVGQSCLMHEFERAFTKRNQLIAQVLLTQQNFSDEKSLQNLQNSLNKLLELNIVPIINENDAVAIEELVFKKHFSDNDMLAALVAEHLHANLLVIVSDVGGLFTANPEKDKKAKLISRVKDLSFLNATIDGKSSSGRGGFGTKLMAAEIALKNGFPLIVTKGKKGFLENILKGKTEGTLFEK